jgi:ATP-dependent protease ClpP protease subunit
VIVPDPAFRPNANRAVYVQGVIDQQLVNRLTSRIIFLQSQSREPLTIFIDSPGGHVASMETILKLLKASNQDFAPACRLITVVTSRAASAAADLLSSGDYAIAYPDSTLLYHGIRMSQSERPLTAEVTSLLANMLRMSNDSYAMELARKIEFRFMFRFVSSKNNFDEIRTNNQQPMSDLECFLAFITDKLSPSAKKVLETAQKRYRRYDAILSSRRARECQKQTHCRSSRLHRSRPL